MKIIYIKKIVSSNLIFTSILKLMYSALHCLKKVRSHTKAKDNNFHIINILLLITIYKIVLVTPV